MYKYVIINDNKKRVLEKVNIIKLIILKIYCKIKKYELYVYERSELWKEEIVKIINLKIH